MEDIKKEETFDEFWERVLGLYGWSTNDDINIINTYGDEEITY